MMIAFPDLLVFIAALAAVCLLPGPDRALAISIGLAAIRLAVGRG